MKTKKKWINLRELPPTMKLDGLRVRYKRNVLGYIKSGWNCGLWLTDVPGSQGVKPWLPGTTIAEVADDLQVEVSA